MKRKNLFCWLLLTCCVLTFVESILFAAEKPAVTYDIEYARIHFSNLGVASVQFQDGSIWTKANLPSFLLVSKTKKVAVPNQVTGDDHTLSLAFNDGAKISFDVQKGRGFLLFHLKEFVSNHEYEQFQILRFFIPINAEYAQLINSGTWEGKRLSISTAGLNVRPVLRYQPGWIENSEGTRHEFTRTQDGKQGYAARFNAQYEGRENGACVRGRPFPKRKDIRDHKLLCLWVHGDGNGETLSIRLNDDQNGSREDRIVVDFNGWKHFELSHPVSDHLNYERVTDIRFSYDHVRTTANCLLDQVEVRNLNGNAENAVILEDFESLDNRLWNRGDPLMLVTDERHGIKPQPFGLVAAPLEKWFEVMPEFENAAGLPSPHLGGVWNKLSPWTKESYLYFMDYRESDLEELIAFAKQGKFKMVLLEVADLVKSHGHYEINTNKFPDGIKSLQRIVARFNTEGIKVGLHVLPAAINGQDSYLTPKPDKRLVREHKLTLAKAIGPTDTVIETREIPEGYPETEESPYHNLGRTIWIDDELIYYEKVSKTPPYGFHNCHRGLINTAKTAHSAGAELWFLPRTYGYYKYDLNSTLADEVAANFAKLANAVPISMIYLDGTESLQYSAASASDIWYDSALLQHKIYNKVKNKDILYQSSTVYPYSWHLNARTASADGHGDLKGYLEERAPAFLALPRENFPLDIGWYYTQDKNATPDMYEYILVKSLAYRSSVSFEVAINQAKGHPFIDEILAMVGKYDELRLSGKIPDSLLDMVKIDPDLIGKMSDQERQTQLHKRLDLHYVNENGKEGFQRVFYLPWHTMKSSSRKPIEIEMKVEHGPVSIGFQVQAMGESGKDHGSVKNPQIVIQNKTLRMPMTLSPGQFGFYLPGQPVTQYGQPLTHPRKFDLHGENVILPNGTYQIRFSFDESINLPFRFRMVQFPKEFYSF